MESLTSTEIIEEQSQLRHQVQEAEDQLALHEAQLGEIQAEWEALADKRVQYDSLEQACLAIEKLSEEGLSRVFWGDRATDEEVTVHLDGVRSAITDLAEEVTDVEHRRNEARRRVERQIDLVEIADDELLQAVEREEARQREWVLEREETEIPWRLQIMPWTRRLDDDDRFHRSLLGSALVCLLLGLLIPFIDLPITEREEVVEVPERFARLIRKEQRPMPKAQPIQKQVEDKPPEVEKVEEVEPEVEPEVTPETQFAEKAAPEVEAETTREKIASTGLLAFRESFSNLAESRPSAKLGADAQLSSSGETATGLPTRNMVATDGPGTSGGINLAELSRDVGNGEGAGGQIDGVQLSRVASNIGASGSSDRPYSAGAIAGRTDEEIQIVFDRYKAALYRLYNRELRRDPTLRGQMVLRLTIEPDGTVSLCQLQASDMEAPVLADQVVTRVLGFDFGAKEVPSVTILYPIDFLPTA